MAGESQEVPGHPPDPSILTTEQLDKAIDNLNALVAEKLRRVEDLMVQRFDDLEKRTTEQKTDTKEAVRDALTSAKELVAQQATSNDRSITKSEQTTAEKSKATDARVDDLKTRVERIEAGAVGGRQIVTDQRAEATERQGSQGILIAALAVVATLVLGAVTIAVTLIASG